MDAAYLLPLLGVLLLLLPLLRDPSATPQAETATAMLYLFGVWTLLIGFAAVLARQLRSVDEPEGSDGSGDPPGSEAPRDSRMLPPDTAEADNAAAADPPRSGPSEEAD